MVVAPVLIIVVLHPSHQEVVVVGSVVGPILLHTVVVVAAVDADAAVPAVVDRTVGHLPEEEEEEDDVLHDLLPAAVVGEGCDQEAAVGVGPVVVRHPEAGM